MILMLLGMWFRIRLTVALEQATTEVRARHMTNAVESLLVTAKAEHTPKICSAIGLLLKRGSVMTFFVSRFI